MIVINGLGTCSDRDFVVSIVESFADIMGASRLDYNDGAIRVIVRVARSDFYCYIAF